MHDTKITIKKRGEVWDVDCPHCFKPHGARYIFSSFTSAIAWAPKHLRARHVFHLPYIEWSHADGKPVVRCRVCDWVNITTTPFTAAAQHLQERK